MMMPPARSCHIFVFFSDENARPRGQVCLRHFEKHHAAIVRRTPPYSMFSCDEADVDMRASSADEGTNSATPQPCLCRSVCIPLRGLVFQHSCACLDAQCRVPLCKTFRSALE